MPLAVLAEPGLMLRQNGAVMVTEATDDRGRSLLPGAAAEPAPGPADRFRQARNEGDAIQVNAVLAAHRPARDGDPPAPGQGARHRDRQGFRPDGDPAEGGGCAGKAVFDPRLDPDR